MDSPIDPGSAEYALLDQLAEEFADRYRRGERPSLREYTDRHPDLAKEIRELFPALVEVDGRAFLIDTGPEMRLQSLRADIRRIDAVLYTHFHADHVHGIDDLKAFYYEARMAQRPHVSEPELHRWFWARPLWRN